MMSLTAIDFWAVAPEIVVATMACLVLVVDVYIAFSAAMRISVSVDNRNAYCGGNVIPLARLFMKRPSRP